MRQDVGSERSHAKRHLSASVLSAESTRHFVFSCPRRFGHRVCSGRSTGRPTIPARLSTLLHNERRTAIGCGNVVVEMTEHVLAALAGLEINNSVVEINAGETPAADGSCLPFLETLESAGSVTQSSAIEPIIIRESLQIEDGPAIIEIHPSSQPGLIVTYEVLSPIAGSDDKRQRFQSNPQTFRDEIARPEHSFSRKKWRHSDRWGLASRHSARDLIVFAADGSIIDNALRFPDECARHKILDIGGEVFSPSGTTPFLGTPDRPSIGASSQCGFGSKIMIRTGKINPRKRVFGSKSV